MSYRFFKLPTVRTATVRILFLIFFLPTCLFSQYDDLIKDENITWIAEFEMELGFGLNQSGNHSNIIDLKKYLKIKGVNLVRTDDWIPQYLFEHIEKGEVQTYKTSELITSYSTDETPKILSVIDTIITYDPETSLEQIQLYKHDISPLNIKTCRTKQVIYLNQKTGALSTRLIAVAPLVQKTDHYGNDLYKVPMAWIKMDDNLDEAFDESSPLVTWATSIHTKATPIVLSQLKVIKGNLDLKKYLSEDALNGKFKIESKMGLGFDLFLTKEQLESIYGVHTDTLITFDPITFDEQIHVIRNEYLPEEINHCRLIQDWYYLLEKRLLINRLKAIAPLIKTLDSEGNFGYLNLMYYITY